MSGFYKQAHLALQDEFGTRALAERVQGAVVTDEITDELADFIQSRNLFFLSTLDDSGNPTVSYKGGATGFARVLNANTLTFPSYDGNGMFLSMGNIEGQVKIGMLFIDFETPRRVRMQGSARLVREGPLLESYPGAELAVEVDVEKVWVNCPRYIHRMASAESSPHVPDAEGGAKLALWKRIDAMQDVLNPADRESAEAAGLISLQEYQRRVEAGEA